MPGGQCVGLTTLPPSRADCLEIWEPQPLEPSGPAQACNGMGGIMPDDSLLYLNMLQWTTNTEVSRLIEKFHLYL